MDGSWVTLCLFDTVLALKQKTGGCFVVLSSSLCLVEEKDENNLLREFLFCRHQRDRWSFFGLKTLVAQPFIIHLEICSSFHVLEDETDYSFTLFNNAYSHPMRLWFGGLCPCYLDISPCWLYTQCF